MDGESKLGQVVGNRGGDDGVSGVEAAVGEVVTHAGDLRPRQVRLSGQHLGGEGFDGLADLDEPDANSIDDEAVGEVAAAGVGVDGVQGRLDVQQALVGVSAHAAPVVCGREGWRCPDP